MRFQSPDDVRWTAPVFRHVVPIDPKTVFASGAVAPEDSATQYAPAVNDLRLASGGAAV